MKRRIISIMLSAIMAVSVLQPVIAAEDSTTLDTLFSLTPKDMTPVEQDYSPGLGDRMDSITFTITFGMIGESPKVQQSYEEALEVQKRVANITNGAHLVSYTNGQDVLRWGSAPYLIEDPSYPMGDGTPGSGYAKYRQYVEDSFKYNVDVAQILEPLLAGRNRNNYASEEEKIPLSCYTHDENGEKKIGWTAGNEYWYLLSMYNLYNTGYAQKAWQHMQDTWNFRTHVYYDAMIPVPEGLYNNPNRTTKYGGVITNTEMEWDAVQREIKHSWENYAISSGQEYIHPKYKGLSCYFTLPYGVVTDNDYLNLWGNSVLIGTRNDTMRDLVWGSELGTEDYSLDYYSSDEQWNNFITRLMEFNLQYLYMMERKPLNYTSNKDIYQVEFSGDLLSTYNKKNDNYTLIENGDFIIADGGDRFIPQVGAGCKIYAYSRDGKTRTWKLPDTWEGIENVDMYKLSFSSSPVKMGTLDVVDGSVTLNMTSKTPYLIVPEGDSPTPKTANFNELGEGETIEEYQGLNFDMSADTDFKLYGANARGGFGSPSIFVDSENTKEIVQIDMEDGAIMHSMKIGNKGGEGRVVLHSSNPLNPDVMIELPKTDQVYKFNTSWVYGETGPVTVKIENSDNVSNVLFDAVMYSETSQVKNCMGGEHVYAHHHVDALCGVDGRDSDMCKFCGHEIDITVLPAIVGEHIFADEEVILTATEYNNGMAARFCLKCPYKTEREIPRTTSIGNLAFHHDFGNNYMQTEDVKPYVTSNGTVAFDILPLDVASRSNPTGPCYIGVWFGKYSICAAYDFTAQKFVIGSNNMEFKSSISKPLASKAYSWTRMSNGEYPAHRFAFSLVGNTATIYLDGTPMLSYTDKSFASSDDVLLLYTKGEFIIDNITVSDSDYDVAAGTGNTILATDFENGSESLSDWILGGYITTDIREFDMSGYFSESHTHMNVLKASHEATYSHGSYDEYECSLCHKRTIVETGDVLVGDVLVHKREVKPTCTDDGHLEYWYDREGKRFSDAAGDNETSLSEITTSALGHDLTYYPAIEASSAEEGFVEYWRCSRCKKCFAEADGKTEIGLVKTNAIRETEKSIAAIGKVKYREESYVNGSGIVGTFMSFDGNACYSVLDVGNSASKLNADYTVEMLIRIRDVDKETIIGGIPGAFFGLSCENFTVGYDFVTEKWGISPISGLFASYPFNPSETGPMCVLDDGYFHNIRFECTTEAIRVFVDDTCVLNSSSLVRENNRYCIFYPRMCTVEFASYAFKYNGVWLNDHLKGRDIISASTWTSRGSGYGTTVQNFSGTTLIDSLRAIEYAESLYDSLSANEKLLVSNYDVLVDARNTYDWLEVRPLYGDANDDGKVNISDVSAILKHIVGWDIQINTELADVNCDGKINLSDASRTLKYIAKWDIVLGK